MPHTITHNELYYPFVYAQATELKREGLPLLVKFEKVDPQFGTLLKGGCLFNCSVRLENTNDGLKLAHTAWLGAESPAVEGLSSLEYNAGGN